MRKKDAVNTRRISCTVSDENYIKLKSFAKVTGKDVGHILRQIINTYIANNDEKFLKSVNVMKEIDSIRCGFGDI